MGAEVSAGAVFSLVRVADGKVIVRGDWGMVSRVAGLFNGGGVVVREETS